ncbi:MAG TPA: biotin--[acetyl-CoA-carboxylase] ligase [Nitrososphaera sp.]|nr:biotin--[acetyl-CoA-carboxylase] ligase [Nitrososphaera sp.]
MISKRQDIPRLLSFLRSADRSGYVSGQSLAAQAGISRSAVWKQIRKLRDYGYGIDSVQGLGYRLVTETQHPVPWELKRILKTSYVGSEVVYLPIADSTQSTALTIANKTDDANGTVVIADRQKSGRGRLKRKWVSPSGGLWFSVLLQPRIATSSITLLPFVAALAVREGIAKSTVLDARLKWPNDVMISGKKVGGILLDVSAEAEAVNYAVIGIGINANVDMTEIRSKIPDAQEITSLKSELGHEVSRLELIRRVLESLEYFLALLIRKGAYEVISAWKNHSDMLGRRITILQNDKPIHNGRALDLGDDGSLIVKIDSGKTIAVTSGDVRLRY